MKLISPQYLQVSFETTSYSNVLNAALVGWHPPSFLHSHLTYRLFCFQPFTFRCQRLLCRGTWDLESCGGQIRPFGTFSSCVTPTVGPLQTTAMPPSDRKTNRKPPSALPSSGRADRTHPPPPPALDEWHSHVHPRPSDEWISRMYMPCNVHGKVKLLPWMASNVDMCEILTPHLVVYSLFFFFLLLFRLTGVENIFLALLFLFHAEKERMQSACEKQMGFSLVGAVFVHF